LDDNDVGTYSFDRNISDDDNYSKKTNIMRDSEDVTVILLLTDKE